MQPKTNNLNLPDKYSPIPTTIVKSELTNLAKDFINTKLQYYEYVQQTTPNTNRLTYNFGYSYFKLQVGDQSFVDIPECFINLLQQALNQLNDIAVIRNLDATTYKNCIVSIYGKNDKLEPHIDVVDSPKRNFYFGDDVIGIVIEPDSEGKFYILKSESSQSPIYNSNTAMHVDEQAGSAFLLGGINRKFPYYHGVSPVAKKRVSITFRTVCF